MGHPALDQVNVGALLQRADLDESRAPAPRPQRRLTKLARLLHTNTFRSHCLLHSEEQIMRIVHGRGRYLVVQETRTSRCVVASFQRRWQAEAYVLMAET